MKTLTGDELRAALKTLVTKGLMFGTCTAMFAPATADERLYQEAASDLQRDGELEIDAPGVVSLSDDGGAYVMAWVWVSDRAIWKGPTDTDGEPCRFMNYYRHEGCEEASKSEGPPEWTMQWSSTCNDECPTCGAKIEPYESIELDLAGQPVSEETREP